MKELNPDDPVVAGMRDLWFKALACLMVKLDLDEVRLTEFDFNKLGNKFGEEMPTIVVSEYGKALRLRIVSESTGVAMAKKAGTL